jgi:aryl-alcohol dehydrogenase-like predicted oxidoreductase
MGSYAVQNFRPSQRSARFGIRPRAGTFGTSWGYGSDPNEARRVFDRYTEKGGNFIDTADFYQFGESEKLVGDFVGSSRDDFVLATKFSLGAAVQASLATTGNSRKVMIRSVEESLKRLKTDRVDLLWVYMPDGITSVEEIVRGLDHLVHAGKIIYAGLSDFPAWRVARAATICELRGWAPLVGLQIEFSLVERTVDRELLPMARALGLGTVAWSPLGGGLLTGKCRKGEEGRATSFKTLIHSEDTAQRRAILDTLQTIAKETGANVGQVAIAWISALDIIPILGARTSEQLEDNLAASNLKLSIDQIRRLDEVSSVPLGFPHDVMAREPFRTRLAGGKLDELDLPTTPVS